MSNWNNDLNSADGTYNTFFAKLMLGVHYSLPCDLIDPTVKAAAIFSGAFRPEARMTLQEVGEEIEMLHREAIQEQRMSGSYRHQAIENGWPLQNDDPKDDPRDL